MDLEIHKFLVHSRYFFLMVSWTVSRKTWWALWIRLLFSLTWLHQTNLRKGKTMLRNAGAQENTI